MTVRAMRTLAGAAAVLLAGCAVPRVELQRVSVPVPVQCQEPMPQQPIWPTESLEPGATLDSFVQAAMAELLRREAYELLLLTALEACRRPIR